MIRITSNTVPAIEARIFPILNLSIRPIDETRGMQEKTFLVGFRMGMVLVACFSHDFRFTRHRIPTEWNVASVFLRFVSPLLSIDLFINTVRYSHCWLFRRNNTSPPPLRNFFKNVNGYRLLLMMNNTRFNKIILVTWIIYSICMIGEGRGEGCFVSSSGNKMIQISILVDWIREFEIRYECE